METERPWHGGTSWHELLDLRAYKAERRSSPAAKIVECYRNATRACQSNGSTAMRRFYMDSNAGSFRHDCSAARHPGGTGRVFAPVLFVCVLWEVSCRCAAWFHSRMENLKPGKNRKCGTLHCGAVDCHNNLELRVFSVHLKELILNMTITISRCPSWLTCLLFRVFNVFPRVSLPLYWHHFDNKVANSLKEMYLPIIFYLVWNDSAWYM